MLNEYSLLPPGAFQRRLALATQRFEADLKRFPKRANETSEGETPFWKSKKLNEMNDKEWESLCDGCARCCLNKLEDIETGIIEWTNVACRLLDGKSCRCKDYLNRHVKVPDCVALTPEIIPELNWLPPTCGYRLIHEGRDLYWWHPLVSGDPETVHSAGISVTGRTISESGIADDELEDFVVAWPGEIPGKRVAAALKRSSATPKRR